jgi:hypothetical protein
MFKKTETTVCTSAFAKMQVFRTFARTHKPCFNTFSFYAPKSYVAKTSFFFKKPTSSKLVVIWSRIVHSCCLEVATDCSNIL